MADIVNELSCIDGEYSVCRWIPVAVQRYGSEGYVPLDSNECPLKDNVSCVSGTGSSMCGGYMGHLSRNVVRCGFFTEEKQ